MFADLTFEEWIGWLKAFRQEPWDEQRKDDRNAVNCIWGVAVHIESEDLPGFRGPNYEQQQTEDIGESIARINALKKKILDGKQHSKTSDPSNH